MAIELKQGDIVMLDSKECIVDSLRLKEVNSRLIRKGEKYWFVDENGYVSYCVNECNDSDILYSEYSYIVGTEAEAETHKKYLALQSEYEKWCSKYPVDWEKKGEKYYIYYDFEDKKIIVTYDTTWYSQGTVFCSNKHHLQKFIDTHSEEDLKLLLGVTKPQRCWLGVE